MKRVSQEELEARAAIFGKQIEVDTAENIAVLTAAHQTWYASLTPVAASAMEPVEGEVRR